MPAFARWVDAPEPARVSVEDDHIRLTGAPNGSEGETRFRSAAAALEACLSVRIRLKVRPA